MQGLARGITYLRQLDRDTGVLDQRVSAVFVWRGAAVALVGGILAGIVTVTELAHGLVF